MLHASHLTALDTRPRHRLVCFLPFRWLSTEAITPHQTAHFLHVKPVVRRCGCEKWQRSPKRQPRPLDPSASRHGFTCIPCSHITQPRTFLTCPLWGSPGSWSGRLRLCRLVSALRGDRIAARRGVRIAARRGDMIAARGLSPELSRRACCVSRPRAPKPSSKPSLAPTVRRRLAGRSALWSRSPRAARWRRSLRLFRPSPSSTRRLRCPCASASWASTTVRGERVREQTTGAARRESGRASQTQGQPCILRGSTPRKAGTWWC